MAFARRERLLLADLLSSVGPDAPTLCEGWKTRDLAAHLVVRERRPDAVAGLVVKPLAGRLGRVQQSYADRPYEELVELIKTGPPKLSPFAIPGADEAANTVEFYVHGEDVRRAQEGWKSRELDDEFSEALWKRLVTSARMTGRKSPVGLVLRRPNGQTAVARQAAPTVTVTGEPAELLLFSMGRQEHADVRLEGAEEDVAAARSAKLGI
ncbi:TIGR03085 family metal-binding protein [Phaeacidiphilus oryzae]|uniref:TIGR03085 family metal-binding protein n=1 Tax=Phaeacidiphilus oryzae TaxID=348818 RepID=UPI000560E6F2|nr:TIGR03085 family metal-binding protein [Phaeacidiphilus oryzae]